MRTRYVKHVVKNLTCVDTIRQNSVTLEGVDNVDDFVERLDRIEPPGQLVALLADPLLQKYVELKPSPIATARIGLWLATSLEEQYEAARSGTGDTQYLSEVLQGLQKYAQYNKVGHTIPCY
jgi:centromere protein I